MFKFFLKNEIFLIKEKYDKIFVGRNIVLMSIEPLKNSYIWKTKRYYYVRAGRM